MFIVISSDQEHWYGRPEMLTTASLIREPAHWWRAWARIVSLFVKWLLATVLGLWRSQHTCIFSKVFLETTWRLWHLECKSEIDRADIFAATFRYLCRYNTYLSIHAFNNSITHLVRTIYIGVPQKNTQESYKIILIVETLLTLDLKIF